MIKKTSLAKRMQVSYASKESGAPAKVGAINWKNVDGEVNFFTPTNGTNRINIIPYKIKTKNHPLVKRGDFDVGDYDYLMDLYVHRSVGPSQASVVCPKLNYGKPCPVCEQGARFRKEGKEKEAGEMKASRRVFYNVQDLNEPEKLKVFETSHFLFEKELIDEARDNENGGFVDFPDIENGKEIKFRCNDVTKSGIKFKEYKSFRFDDRGEPISEELINSAISFDEVLNVLSYEDINNLLYGKSDEDKEDDESIPIPPPNFVGYEESERVPEQKESPKVEKAPEASKDNLCKSGHSFGKDADEYDDCFDCDCWDKCVKAK